MTAPAMPAVPAATTKQPDRRYRVYWFDRLTLIQAPSLIVDTRSRRFVRLAVTLMVALRKPFRLQNEHGDFVEYRAAMVSPRHVRRCLDGTDSDLTIVEIDVAHPMFGPLMSRCDRDGLVVPSDAQVEALQQVLAPSFGSAHSCEEAQTLIEALVAVVAPGRSRMPAWDARILSTIEAVEAAQGESPTPAMLASRIFLSESRLRHLFKDQTGCTLAAYLRWACLRRALNAIAQGSSLEQAARQTGFYDRAHLNRVINEHMVERISEIRSSSAMDIVSCRMPTASGAV